MAESEPHAYARACRNTQHPGCTCMHPVDGRWCGRPRNDPIHQPRPAAERERRISAMQDEDDLRGMLPDEIVAVVKGLEADLAGPCPPCVNREAYDRLCRLIDWDEKQGGQ